MSRINDLTMKAQEALLTESTDDMSIVETLAVALVLNRGDWLRDRGFTIAQALGFIGNDWIEAIPTAARNVNEGNKAIIKAQAAARQESTRFKDDIFKDYKNGCSIEAIAQARSSSEIVVSQVISDLAKEDEEYTKRYGPQWNELGLGRKKIQTLETLAVFDRNQLEIFATDQKNLRENFSVFQTVILERWVKQYGGLET